MVVRSRPENLMALLAVLVMVTVDILIAGPQPHSIASDKNKSFFLIPIFKLISFRDIKKKIIMVAHFFESDANG